MRNYFPEEVYQTVIPRNIRLSEAPSHGLPIHQYDPICRGAAAYEALAAEVARRERLPGATAAQAESGHGGEVYEAEEGVPAGVRRGV